MYCKLQYVVVGYILGYLYLYMHTAPVVDFIVIGTLCKFFFVFVFVFVFAFKTSKSSYCQWTSCQFPGNLCAFPQKDVIAKLRCQRQSR